MNETISEMARKNVPEQHGMSTSCEGTSNPMPASKLTVVALSLLGELRHVDEVLPFACGRGNPRVRHLSIRTAPRGGLSISAPSVPAAIRRIPQA